MSPEAAVFTDLPVDDQNIFSCDVDGYAVHVGRNDSSCEKLVSQHKRDHARCLWMHALGAVGSHVILCLGEKGSVPYDTLRKIGKIAIENSRSRGTTVRFATLDHVFKPEGAPRGIWQAKPYQRFDI